MLMSREVTPEFQYLRLVEDIIAHGAERSDRTGTGTLSIFAPPQLRFSLADNTFPLLTTKKTFLRPIFEELMWFIRGQTDGNILSEKKVKIWDGNGSKEYLESIGLGHRREKDLGPVYGFQWRHFGAEYVDGKLHSLTIADADYSGKGVDQLKYVLDKIVNDPTNRRILLCAWNPKDLPIMALPPCHMFCQFYVDLPCEKHPKGRLSCQMYQRSCDLGLGVPFNIASYSLLTIMIAHVTGLEPGEFVHVMGDAHVYKDHIEPLKVQLDREPRPFPKMYIRESESTTVTDFKNVDMMLKTLESFEYDSFELKGYDPHDKIVMKMSV